MVPKVFAEAAGTQSKRRPEGFQARVRGPAPHHFFIKAQRSASSYIIARDLFLPEMLDCKISRPLICRSGAEMRNCNDPESSTEGVGLCLQGSRLGEESAHPVRIPWDGDRSERPGRKRRWK